MRLFFPSLISAFVLISIMAFVTPGEKITRIYTSRYENVLGTSMEIKIKARSEKQAAMAENAAMTEIQRLSKILSGYDAESEFSQWMKTINKPVHVSKDLYAVLALFDKWRIQTNGALDASAEVVGQLWKRAALNKQLPTQSEINMAIAEVKQLHWKLDPLKQTATHLTTTPLRLNSFAKSYIINSATTVAMNTTGVIGITLNIGGDILITGSMNETVFVADPKANAENDQPFDQLQIQNKAIATSGNYRRGELINAVWYSHIVDPRNGFPASEVISATVVAPSAIDAGALATAFNVLSTTEIKLLAESLPGVDYLVVTKNGEQVESKNWKALKISVPSNLPITDHQKDWKNELTITLALKQQQGFAKRPFVAVWVVDNSGATVKTIALWYNKPRWLRDLREWYRSNGAAWTADANNFASITGATRTSGNYTLKWDGKDDKGQVLKENNYTIYIEAVREHGGYDILHQEIDCSQKSAQFNLKGNAELSEVTFTYGKK